METILIKTKNEEELQLIKSFLEQHNLQARVLSDDDKEDILLGKLMEETNYDDIINTKNFLDNLRN